MSVAVRIRPGRIIAVTLLLSWLVACRSEAPPVAKVVTEEDVKNVEWRRVGSWSGKGNQQLETFPIERWIWRVQWEARNDVSQAGTGSLRVAALSADSGREIAEITDVRGADHDTKYVSDLPRRYYLVVTSQDVDWSLIVEEPLLD